jgi:predicted HicB family RNase H-like nuclease
MKNIMSHKGYSALIQYDADGEIFFGELLGIRDIVGFHADNVPELKTAFVESVEDYLETCRKIGREPQKPYSGNLMLRVDPAVHSSAARAAEAAGQSLNQWGETALKKAAEDQLA